MKNGRCRIHGGRSTGARTDQGKFKARTANWKHGLYSQEAQKLKTEFYRLQSNSDVVLEQIELMTMGDQN